MSKIIKVAELGINHNGSLDITKKLIDIAVEGKCDYVKFQKRSIDLVYPKEELEKYRESPWGTTFRAQKEGLEFNKEQYDEIDSYCKEKNIKWFASPWDMQSAQFLMQYNPDFIKIPSALITKLLYLKYIRESILDTNTKIIISTGMSSFKEIINCMETVGYFNIEHILSTTSTYPTNDEDMNMSKIKSLQLLNWPCKIGFSNHSSGILFLIVAASLGCKMLEYHITLDRSMYGSDQSSSIEPAGISKIRDYIDAIETGWGNGQIECLECEIPVRKKLRGE